MNPTRVGGALRAGWRAQIEDYATAAAWSRDGSALLVADAAGSVYALDARSGALVWSRPVVPGAVFTLRPHPREPLLAVTGEDGGVSVLDLHDGALAWRGEGQDAWVEHAAWTPDGAWLACAHGRYLRLWSVAGEMRWQSPEARSAVTGLAWTPGGNLLSACYGGVRVQRPLSSEPPRDLAWKGSLVSLALSPDGEIVACGSQDRTVHFWRLATGEDSEMSGYDGKPLHLAFDRDSAVLATSGGTLVVLWRFADGGPEATRPGVIDTHRATVSAVAFAARSRRLATADADGRVLAWEVSQDARARASGEASLGAAVEALAWRPDDRALAAIGADGRVSTWRMS